MEIKQVERVVVVVECCVLGALGEVPDMVVLPKWRMGSPLWSANIGECCANS